MTTVYPQTSASESRFNLRNATLVLVVLGLFITGYLSYTKLANTSVVCVESSAFNCDAVTSSIYSKFLGIDVAYLGFGLDVLILSVLLLERRVNFFRNYGVMILFGLTLWGFLYHDYLTLMAVTRIQALCIWCLAAHTTMTLMLILTSIRLYRVLFPAQASE